MEPQKEWSDNGEGLSGIRQNPFDDGNGNTWNYLTYIDQEKLNYFRFLRDNGLISDDLIISGHSKGSRQAMLIGLLFSGEINRVYGFCGQNISPEMGILEVR